MQLHETLQAWGPTTGMLIAPPADADTAAKTQHWEFPGTMGKNHLATQGTQAPLLWSGRIPLAMGQLSPGASTTAPVHLEPVLAVRTTP